MILKENPAPESTAPAAASTAKVVLFLDHTAKLGGGEIALLSLVCGLDKARYRSVVALADDGPLVGRLRDAGIETYLIPLDAAILNTRKDSLGVASLMKAGQVVACVRYAFRIAALARQVGANIIHTNSLKSDLYGGLAGRLVRIPVLWHVRDTIDHYYLPRLVAAAFRFLARLVPQAIVANSESTLRLLHLPPRKPSAVLYSGIAPLPDGFSYSAGPPAEEAHSEGPRAAIIALVGRISGWKGQHIFIAAAAEVSRVFPGTRFQIIGTPLFGEQEYERSLVQLAERLGVSTEVEFLGFRDDVPLLLAKSDIVVHASILEEPFGQVVVQGMAAGKPVIATDGGALREIVVPGVTGLLVPRGEAAPMAEAILQLLSDLEKAQQMGIAGRQRVQERFLISHTIRKLQGFYDQLLKHSDPEQDAVNPDLAADPKPANDPALKLSVSRSRRSKAPVLRESASLLEHRVVV